MNKKIMANAMVCLMLATILTVCCSVSAGSESVELKKLNEKGSIRVELSIPYFITGFPYEVWCNLEHAQPHEENGVYTHTFNDLEPGMYTVTAAPSPPLKANTKIVYLSEGESKTVDIAIYERKEKTQMLNILGLFQKNMRLINIFENILKL